MEIPTRSHSHGHPCLKLYFSRRLLRRGLLAAAPLRASRCTPFRATSIPERPPLSPPDPQGAWPTTPTRKDSNPPNPQIPLVFILSDFPYQRLGPKLLNAVKFYPVRKLNIYFTQLVFESNGFSNTAGLLTKFRCFQRAGFLTGGKTVNTDRYSQSGASILLLK